VLLLLLLLLLLLCWWDRRAGRQRGRWRLWSILVAGAEAAREL
jgi:hypothetical protein